MSTAQVIFLMGATATGKTELAVEIAKRFPVELISVDSALVYREMNIGTAKPDAELLAQTPHFLIDIIDPTEFYSAWNFVRDARLLIEQIEQRGNIPLLVGGTMMYYHALENGLNELPQADFAVRARLDAEANKIGWIGMHEKLATVDPASADRIKANDSQRIQRALEVYEITGRPISGFQQQWDTHNTQYAIGNTTHNWTIIGLRREKADAGSRINKRVKKMIASGLVDEVKSLLAEEKPLSKQARCAIGYAEIIEYLAGRSGLEDATELIKKNTRRLAKSQRTWFKTFKNAKWLNIDVEESPEEILKRTKALLNNAGGLSSTGQ